MMYGRLPAHHIFLVICRHGSEQMNIEPMDLFPAAQTRDLNVLVMLCCVGVSVSDAEHV